MKIIIKLLAKKDILQYICIVNIKHSINFKTKKDMIKTEIKKVDFSNNAAIIEKTLFNCLGYSAKKYQIIDFSYFD